MEKILSDFGVQPLLLLAQAVNFLVLLYILKRLLYKPILKVLEERKRTIEESLNNAEEIKRKLEETAEEEQKRILAAAREGEKIIKEAQDAGVLLIEESKKRAESLYQEILDQAHSQVKADREKMMQEMREHLSEFVMIAMEKVAGKAFDRSKQKKLVDDAVREL